MTAPTISELDAKFLSTLQSVRKTCQVIFKCYQDNKNEPNSVFELDTSKLPDITEFILELIERDYAPRSESHRLKSLIPPHGRWRHFTTLNGEGKF